MKSAVQIAATWIRGLVSHLIVISCIVGAGGVLAEDSPAQRAKAEKYKKLRASLTASLFSVKGNKVLSVVKESSLDTAQAKDLQLLRSLYDRIRDRVSVPDGAKVFIESRDPQRTVVVFEAPTGPNELGADYAARVTLNTRTGAIVELLVGS